MKNLKDVFFLWLIRHNMSFLLRALTFPRRLLHLRVFIEKREREAMEFVVGEWVRLKQPPLGRENVKVIIGPQAQDWFDETDLGEETQGGRVWKERHYGPGGMMHSFFEARDPWKITRIQLSDIGHDIRWYLRGTTLSHRCSLTLENPQVIFGDKVIPWVPAQLVEKVLPDTA